MSVLLLLCCDADTGGLCGAQLLTAHATPADARRYAATQGWTVHGDEDRCPRHNARPPPRPRVTPFDTDPHT